MTVALLAWFLLSPLVAVVIGASIRFANGGAAGLGVAAEAADELDCPGADVGEFAAA